MDAVKDKLTIKLNTDFPYIEHLLYFAEKNDIKTFVSEIRKYDTLLRDIEIYIKNKENLVDKRNIWGSLFITITMAFRDEMTEKEGQNLDKIYYMLIMLLPEIIETYEDEKELFAKIAKQLGDSEEYGRELLFYRALRYSIQYNDEVQAREILDSKFLDPKKRYFETLDFHDEKDPVDQSKMIRWFLYRYDISNAIRYLSMIPMKWCFMIKPLHWLINRGGGLAFLFLFLLYCNMPVLTKVRIPEHYFYYLEFLAIGVFLIFYYINRNTSKDIDPIKAMLLIFQISLPRMWGAILMGIITIALAETGWIFPLHINARSFFLICILMFIAAFLYLYLEVTSHTSDTERASDKTSKILLLGFLESFFLSILVSRLFAASVFPYLISEENLLDLQDNFIYFYSDYFGLPNYIESLKIFPPIIILWSFLSLLIGMFIQNFWARENLTTSPFEDKMELGEAPKAGEN